MISIFIYSLENLKKDISTPKDTLYVSLNDYEKLLKLFVKTIGVKEHGKEKA